MDLSNYPVTHAEEIINLVSIYLAEDVGDGDLTASLVPTELDYTMEFSSKKITCAVEILLKKL
jgi:nicotinate-nucleotide pyrophosphorylase